MSDPDTPPQQEEEQEQDGCYAGLPSEIVSSLEQRVLRIKRTVVQTALDIGRELAEGKQEIIPYKAGGFKGWVTEKIGYTEAYAYQLLAVHEQFGKAILKYSLSNITDQALRLLAAPSIPPEMREALLVRAEAGKKITIEVAKDFLKAQKHVEEAEQAARINVQAQQEIARLTHHIEDLRSEITSLTQPETEIREVVPPEVTVKMEQLQAQVRSLTEQRNNLSQRVEQLGAELDASEEQRAYERSLVRIRHHWREVTSTFGKQVRTLLGQFPASADTLAFEADDWDRLAHTEALVQRFVGECQALRQHRVIDAREVADVVES